MIKKEPSLKCQKELFMDMIKKALFPGDPDLSMFRMNLFPKLTSLILTISFILIFT
jgi:hypothetical protein